MTSGLSVKSNFVLRIMIGLLVVFLVLMTVSRLADIVRLIRMGMPPEVVWVYGAQVAALAVLSVIGGLFALRGDRPSGRRQSVAGCIFVMGAGFLAMVAGQLVFSFLSLEEGSEAALRLAAVPLGGAVGGLVGLFVARPSSRFLERKVDDSREPTEIAMESPELTEAKRVRRNSAATAAIAALVLALFGFLILPLTALVSPCIAEEVTIDSGFGIGLATLSLMIWAVAGPMAMLFAGLVVYSLFPWLHSRARPSIASLAVVVSGALSGLISLVISVVLYHMYLCTNVEAAAVNFSFGMVRSFVDIGMSTFLL